MYKVAIIEDDLLSQEVLKDLLLDHSHKYQLLGTCNSVEQAVKFLKNTEIDLILLDMELIDGRGFDILQQLEQFNFEVIITTMHDSFMLEAIKHSATDYLMKPIGDGEFKEALNRFETKIEKLGKLNSSVKSTEKLRLVIPNSNGLTILETKDIVRLESDGAYTNIFMVDQRNYMVSKNLGYYETVLTSSSFFRAHHKHLINLNHVKSYSREDGGSVHMSENSIVQVSRRRKEQFLQQLENA